MGAPRKACAAAFANIRPLLCMDLAPVPSQVGVLHEARPTARVVTGVRFYPCMGAYVHGQDVVPREARAAICADVGPFPRVSTVVLDQVAALCEALPTARVVTDVRFLKSVDAPSCPSERSAQHSQGDRMQRASHLYASSCA